MSTDKLDISITFEPIKGKKIKPSEYPAGYLFWRLQARLVQLNHQLLKLKAPKANPSSTTESSF